MSTRIIDNVNDLLGDDLRAEITSGCKVRVAASTFSIFAFEVSRMRSASVPLSPATASEP
jgi:hypothetical protein